jgi:hypothetical protein
MRGSVIDMRPGGGLKALRAAVFFKGNVMTGDDHGWR